MRNIHGGIENPYLKTADWTIGNFRHIFNAEFLRKLKWITMCGDYGDPIMNNDLLKMCRYVSETHSATKLNLHTNGSARTTKWWKDLATSTANIAVMFGIDGLEDTHSLHRIGTDYKKIIQNAKAYIDAGGEAHWVFIRFKHNQHQEDSARELSKQLGFKSFIVKNSRRFGKSFPVLDKDGSVSHIIEQPTYSDIQPVTFKSLKEFKTWDKLEYDCFAKKDGNIFIDANCNVFPCCITAAFVYACYDVDLYKKHAVYDSNGINKVALEVKDNILQLIKDFNANVIDVDMKAIVNSEMWQKWDHDQTHACRVMCSSKTPYISIEQQRVNRAS
jgi:hypothetical protein